jgi:hypothetical protein
MLYAIQGNSVRWFFTPEEDHHLFATFTQYDENAEVIVRGNWDEGLVFSPVIYKGRRPKDGTNGSFPIIAVSGVSGSIKTIATPLEHLKVSRLIVHHLKPMATIACKLTKDRRELLVYPQIIEPAEAEQVVIQHNESTTGSTAPSKIEDPATEQQANESTEQQPMSSEAWALELINEINALLVANPTIAVIVDQTGKDTKFVRKVIKRRQII